MDVITSNYFKLIIAKNNLKLKNNFKLSSVQMNRVILC